MICGSNRDIFAEDSLGREEKNKKNKKKIKKQKQRNKLQFINKKYAITDHLRINANEKCLRYSKLEINQFDSWQDEKLLS